jgi:peptidoglycan/LPS O-acetylase OafA/YrhL
LPSDPTTLPGPGRPGRRSPRLDAILLADAARERARNVRGASMMLLAALGFPLWLIANWPARFPHELRVLAATIWALGALVVVAAAVREQWWSRVRSRRIEGLGPLPRLRSERPGARACAATPEEED